MFWAKINGKKEDETSIERVKRLETRLTRVEAEILDVATAQDIIRNKVLRKIQVKKEVEEEEESGTWAGIPTK
jgi:archaellum component FlaC